MRRSRTLCPEILQRLHYARTKELLPNTIHGCARGQWIIWTHQPFRESEPVVARVLWKVVQGFRNVGSYGVTLYHPITTFEYICGSKLIHRIFYQDRCCL